MKSKQKINKKNLIRLGFHVWRQFDDPYYQGFAAQIAYFFFMASMPTLIVLSQFLGIFDVSLDFARAWLTENMSASVANILEGFLDSTSVGITNAFLIIVALWSASSLEFSLSRLASYTMTEGTYRFNFWLERVKSIPLSLISIFAIAFGLIIFVFGEAVFTKLFDVSGFGLTLIFLRVPIALALYFGMVLVNYYLLPRIRVPIKCVLPGAIFASVGMLIITGGYAIYIGYIADYNIIYGSFANIVALMFWFYLISWVLCIGIMFNIAWDDVMGKNLLTNKKMKEYLRKQRGDDYEDEYKKFWILDNEIKSNKLPDTIAVKASKRFLGEEVITNRDVRSENALDNISKNKSDNKSGAEKENLNHGIQ